MVQLRAVGVVAAAALLAACTAPWQPDGGRTPTATPTPTPPPVYQAELQLPEVPATVIEGADRAALAAGVSAALFASAPVAVVASAVDGEAYLRAASAAVALGSPLLLHDRSTGVTEPSAGTTATTTDPATDPAAAAPTDVTADELSRLGVLAVLVFGDVEVPVEPSVTVVQAPADDADLAALLGLDLERQVVEPTGDVTGPTIAVAGLDRESPVLLATGPAMPAATATPTAPTEDADADAEVSAGGTGRPTGDATAAPTESPAAPALPLTELAETPDGGLVLTTGDPTELAAVATARAAGLDVIVVSSGDPRVDPADIEAIAAVQPTTTIGIGSGFGVSDTLAWKVATAATGVELPGGGQVLFPGRRMVALYGTPDFPALGILGEQDPAASVARVQGLAAEYQALTPDTVVGAFEIIVTIASAGPGEDGNYSNELPVETFIPWVEAARDAGVYVVLDLQPGRTDFLTQAKLYEPLLLYPNVGLALDPEWRLGPNQVHLVQIGSVDVSEVNAVGDYLAELTRTNYLPQKLLVLHQFMLRMIQGRENVTTTHEELAVLIHADGQGNQGGKNGTWQALHVGEPPGVVWGWKNFIDEDVPMLTPAQTYQVQPIPSFVSYQ